MPLYYDYNLSAPVRITPIEIADRPAHHGWLLRIHQLGWTGRARGFAGGEGALSRSPGRAERGQARVAGVKRLGVVDLGPMPRAERKLRRASRRGRGLRSGDRRARGLLRRWGAQHPGLHQRRQGRDSAACRRRFRRLPGIEVGQLTRRIAACSAGPCGSCRPSSAHVLWVASRAAASISRAASPASQVTHRAGIAHRAQVLRRKKKAQRAQAVV